MLQVFKMNMFAINFVFIIVVGVPRGRCLVHLAREVGVAGGRSPAVVRAVFLDGLSLGLIALFML